MNRNKKMQILAVVALLSIVFSVLSTALLILFPWNTQPTNDTKDLSDFLTGSWTIQAEIPNSTGTWTQIVLSWATVTASWSSK